MDRRARRWRLPLAARVVAVPVLVALAGALAFGFTQSDAAPAAGEPPTVTVDLNAGGGLHSNTGPYGGRVLAEIIIVGNGAGERPQGTVDLEVDGTTVATGLPLKNGMYTGTTTGWLDLMQKIGYRSPGTYTITGKYVSNDGHANASGSNQLTVFSRKTDGKWSVSTEPTKSSSGQAVTLKARLDDWGFANEPTGQVRFFHKENGTWAEIARGPINGHEATATFVFKDPGDQVINAAYDGDTNYSPVAAGLLGDDWTHKVVAASTTTLTSATNPATLAEQPVSFTVKVAANGKPSGTVVLNKLEDGKAPQKIADGTLGADGTAKLTATLPVGTTKLRACFTSSDAGIADSCSTKPLEQVVTKNPSTVALTADPTSVQVGAPVTLTSTVAGAAGTVTFLDGTAELGKADLDKDGKATFTTSALGVGTHNLTARFGGSDKFAESTSQAVSVQVNAAGQAGQEGSGGSTPQPKNLASTGAMLVSPVGIGALLLILGAVAVTVGRRRRARSSR